MSFTRRDLLGTAATAFTAAHAQSSNRPNVLYIVTDSWRGQTMPGIDPNLKAPNLERLARDGVQCERAYTSYAVCCPSRAAMLTGKFPHAAGVRRNHSLLPLDQPTMSAELKKSGYRTGYIGKWHLDRGDSDGFVPAERRRGFDYWAAHNVQHRHYDCVYFGDTPEPVKSPGFEPDHQTNLAIDFLKRPSRAPFYLHLSYVAPHAPYTPPIEHASYDPARLQLRPNVHKTSEGAARTDLAGYYGLCSAVDANIGRLLDALDERGLARDTIVVFTSDHGSMMGSQGMDAIDVPFEEALQIPLLIRYPRRVKAGIKEKALISNVDFAPTLLSLCGLKAPASMQGVNQTPLLTGKTARRAESIYAEGSLDQPEEWRMVLWGVEKLVVDRSLKPTHLFHLGSDPYEQENLVERPEHASRRESLLAHLRQWASRTGDLTQG